MMKKRWRTMQLFWAMWVTHRDVVWDYTEIEQFLERAGDWE